LEFEGRDGTGPKSEVPWLRFYSEARSPKAHQGWYCVYLFSATGSNAYLCLAHGSTRYENDEFRPRKPEELAELVQWARNHLGADAMSGRQSTEINLEAKGSLGPAYENETVCAVQYEALAIQEESVLLQDVLRFAELLTRLYDAEDLGRSPDGEDSEARLLQTALDAIVAPQRTRASGGQGFGLTHAERTVVDRHAMALAEKYLKKAGYKVTDVSRNNPFDFVAVKDEAKVIIEVKGTTSTAQSILLTANEVAAHRRHYPANALIVVHSIDLDRTSKPPAASGGKLCFVFPWSIDESTLKPLSFQLPLILPPEVVGTFSELG